MNPIDSESDEPATVDTPVEYAAPMQVSGLAPTPTPSPTPPPSPSLTSRATTALIANLQGLDVGAVERVVEGVGEAMRAGDKQAIVDRLLAQALLLEALGVKLLSCAGGEKQTRIVEIYTGLGLRALDGARKTLATLADKHGSAPPGAQTNVQINLGADGRANEIGVTHGQ